VAVWVAHHAWAPSDPAVTFVSTQRELGL
jgi:hypothetical protein